MANIGERISEQVFTDLIQLLFDEKIITEREGNLILATASDDVLGKDAPEIRARMLRKILQRLDKKRIPFMSEYSIKMQEVFSVAQYQAARFESPYLESWHVLLAMVAIHDSVAGLTFAEYQTKIAYEEYEAAAVLAIGKSPLTDVDRVHFVEQSKALSDVLAFAESICQVTGGNEIGTEHVLYAMLLNLDLFATRLLEVAGFKNKEMYLYEGEWVGDGEDWQYRLTDGSFLKASWLKSNGHWYYLGKSSYMQRGTPENWHKTVIYFAESGAMMTGWIYEEETDQWYHANEDGALTTGWYQAGNAWYWFDSKCVMFSGGNRMVNGHKYLFL